MKSPRSSLASRISVAFILGLTGLMVLMASAISVSRTSPLGTGSFTSSVRAESTAAPNPRESFASTLASQPSPLNPFVNTTVTATKTHTPAGNRAPGDTLMYTVVITNTGAADATNVIFTDTIDPNTTLVMGSVNSSPIAFDDSYTASGNIPIAPATSLLANDIDPDSGTNAGLTVTQVQGAGGNVGNPTNTTATGIGGVAGSVTVQSNGSFTYEPPPGFTGADTFTYQISDAGGKTSTATVTITISNMVWFIDNTSAAANSRGTFSQPFKTIAAFNAVNTGAAPNPQNGHHVVLRPASGSYAETDGVNLRDSQTLTGPAVAFNTVFTANANSTAAYNTFAASTGTAATITTTAGNGVELGSGNALRGFNVGNTPAFFGFNGTAVGTLTVATVSKTGTGGAMSVSTSGAFGSTVNFGTFESTSSTTNNLNLVSVTGTLGVTSGGTGFAGSAAANAAINVNGGTLTFSYPGNVTKATTGALLSVSNGHMTGTLTFTGTLNASSGTGLQFDNADGTYNFNGTTTLSGGDAGVDILNGSGGTFSFTSGTAITSPTGTGFNVNSSSPSVTYSGNITQNTAGQRVINIDTTSSNTITFQTGTITGGASSTGININAASGNVTFSNGMTLGTSGSRMTNQALTMTGGSGTISLGVVSIFTNNASGLVATNVDGTINNASTSVVDTSNATAINIDGPVGLTSLGLSFTSVTSAGGTADGISIQDTNGSFTISGDGANTSVGGNSTGGTISGKSQSADGSTTSGIGIYLNNVTNITLRRITINGTNQNYGIRAFAVNGFTMEYSTVGGTNGTTASIDNYGEGSVYFGNFVNNGITGTGTFTNNNISGGRARNQSIVNGGAAATLNLTVKGCTFGAIQNFGDGGDSFDVEVRTSGSTANVTFGGTNAGEPNTLTNAVGNLTSFAAQTGASIDVQFKNNILSNNNANNIIGGCSIIIQGQGQETFSITGNTMRDANGSAIALGKQSVGTLLSGFIANNTVGVSGVADSGSKTGNGIFVSASGVGTVSTTIKDNTIQQIHGNSHIYADNTGGSYAVNMTIEHNTFNNWEATNFAGIAITNGAPSSGDTTNVCAKIGGSTAAEKNIFNLGANLAVIVGVSGLNNSTTHTFNLPGYAGGANLTNVQNFIAGNNTMNTATVSAYDDNGANGAAFKGNGTNCGTPASIPPPFDTLARSSSPTADQTNPDQASSGESTLRASRGEGPYADDLQKLKQEDLNWMVQAAIGRWVETGLSTEDLVRMQGVTFEVADLPNSELATIAGEHVKIDDTAAGFGWYFDQSPAEDGEFQVVVPEKELNAAHLSPARWTVDLLTVLMRELGEVYLQRTDRLPKRVVQNISPMMEPTLLPGVRRLPLNQFRVTPPTTGSIKPAAGQSVQATTAATEAGATPGSTEPGSQAETDAANVLASTDRFAARARYAVYNSAMYQRSATNAVMKFNNARDASAYAAIRARRVRSASPVSGETVTVNGSGAGFTIPVGKSVTIMFQATINNPMPANVCTVTNPAPGSGVNVTGSNFTSVTIAADSATVAKAPTIGMCPANITKNTDPNVCTAVTTFTPPTSDACPAATVTCSPASGFAFVKGTTTVTCTAANGVLPNATCTFTVTVNDAQAPVLSGCTNQTLNTAAGVCTATATYTPTATDNCDGSRPVTCVPASGSTFNKGVTTVSCSASDLNSPTANTGMCTFTITVNDNQAPVLSGCTNQSLNTAPGVCTATATYAPTATDNCDGSRPVTCVPASGATFNKGVTTVSCSASDLNAPPNTGMCTFTITVTDNQAPVLSGCTNITTNTAAGVCTAAPTFTPTATDNCDGSRPVTCVPASGSTFNKGVTTVSCSASDLSSNTGMCSFTVTVNDNQAPVLSGCTNQSINAGAGACTATATYTVTATDNCDGSRPVTCVPASGSTFNKGVTTVTCSASDLNAPPNTGMCTFTITVNDTQPPVVTCPAAGGAFAASDCLPSQRSAYTGATLYSVGPNTVTNAVLSNFTPCTAPPVSGTATINFTGILTGDLAMGGPPAHFQAPVTGSMKVTFNNLTGPTRTFDTEMLQLDISGGNLPAGVQLRESPTLTSTGQTKITTVTGGFHIDSFFDVFMELSTNSGGSWTPDPTARHISAVQSTDSGACNAVVNYPAATATDNCDTVTPTCVPASGATFSKGVTTVSCSVTDTSGNPGACSFTVTVVDTQLPTLTCPSNISVIGNACSVQTYTTPTASDNCPGATVACLPASGTCFAVGTTTVTCTATDTSGNTGSCSFTVSVIPCTINCPTDITDNTAPGTCAHLETFPDPTTTGQCGTVTCSPLSGSSFPKGVTTVTCSTTAGPSCTFTVTINDNELPTITCPNPITQNTDLNLCTAVVSFTPTVNDNCPGATPSCNPASGSVFSKGVTTVFCKAIDASSNVSPSCTFTVTVVDNQAPTVVCPANISKNTDLNLCTAVATYVTPTGSDNCAVQSVVCTPASGTAFAKGVTTVTCTVTDTANLTGMCTFTVTVVDNQAPTVTCPAPITQNTDPGVCTAVVTYTTPTGSDNCPLPPNAVVCSPASGTAFAKGVTTVTCTVTDSSNLTGNCTFTVTVVDNQAPTVVCPAPVTQSTDSNLCTAVVNYTTPTGSDNCPLPPNPVVCSPASGSVFPKGITTVTCTVTDSANLTGNCMFTVTVNDTQLPVVTCPANISQPATSGQCTAVVTYSNATATDNCGVSGSPVCAPASGSTFQKGVTTVTCTVSDTSNNVGSCTFTVTITDTQPPVITCPAPVVHGTDPGVCNAKVTYPNATATDNCSGVGTPTCTPASGTTFQKGVTTVTCNVTDGSGNPASCTFTVTVNDTQNPTVTCPNNINFTTPGNSDLCGFVNYPAPTSSDNCGVQSTVCTPASGFCFPVGMTTVTCTATDTSGNQGSCTFKITVSNPCTITCPPDQMASTGPGATQCGTAVTYPAPTTTGGGCGTVTCSPASGSFFPVGMTTVTCTTNGPSCSFKVTVVDNTPPVFPNCAGITMTAQPSCPFSTSTAVSFTTPAATDNCPGTPSVTCVPPTGSMFPVGTTSVTCTAKDASNNMATCTFPVNVFTFCLQDDSTPGNVVFVNATTGDYLFCSGGVPIASGRGDLTVRGCQFGIEHVKGDRRVHIGGDTSANNGLGAGNAVINKTNGHMVIQITDRNMSNNACACSPSPPQANPRDPDPDPGKRISGN